MTVVGFTGSRTGMTERQKEGLKTSLLAFSATEFHHGDCLGADTEAHDVASLLGLRIVVHPPLDDSQRAYRTGNEERHPFAYLTRNHNIVDACDVLIAAPNTRGERMRSGTWSTIRYAKKILTLKQEQRYRDYFSSPPQPSMKVPGRIRLLRILWP